jgi:hypothetical protein
MNFLCNLGRRLAAIVLIILGVILLLFALPGWFWLLLLAIAVIVVGVWMLLC